NIQVDALAAKEIAKLFVEVVIAPDFSGEALTVFSTKPDIRLLKLPDMKEKSLTGFDIKRVAGGVLLQDWDTRSVDIRPLEAVTKREPTAKEIEGLEFAWKVAKHVKSNAIVYALMDRTAGVGMGQTSRVYAARAGAINATEPLSGSVVASDGFFPFRDIIDNIKRMGVTAVVQPGGSVNDKEVIAAADEHDIAMLFTNTRHFKH
ncbi:hypothetical protein LCGC14_1440870, partial [marine sediment metagenome]